MIPIYVPSMGRADARLLKGPAAQVPADHYVCYVVPQDEVQSYAAALAKHDLAAFVLGCPERGIARTRRWIGNHAWERGGHDKFVMMDDDIGFLVRMAPDNWQLRSPSKDEVGEMLAWIERQLDTHAHVSVSAREGNNRAGVGDSETLVMENTRTLRLLAYRTELFLAMEHGRVEVMEDFDVNLQLLRAGHSNIVSYWWAQGQRMTNEAGGCSTYRSHEVHEASARRLAELHPGLVSLRQKVNKTDREGFGSRVEVTIQWKKSYAEGQALRRRLGEG